MRLVTRVVLMAAALATVVTSAGCSSVSGTGADGSAGPAAPTESVAQAFHAGVLPDEATLRDEVGAALEGSGIPGGTVLVIDDDGERRLVVFGEAAEGEPVTEATRFAYRSVTKPFIGTVVLQLVDEGLVGLDDPITDHLPDLDRVLDLDSPPTVRQLGAMRSGIANYSAAPDLVPMLLADPAREPNVEELVALAVPDTPVFEPGTRYEYSNTNTLLLGQLIESVTGNDWMAEVTERLLDPLGLASVAYGFQEEGQAALPVQIAEDGALEPLPAAAPGWFGAAGGLTGDIGDLAAWGRALGSGETISATSLAVRVDALGPITDDPSSPSYDEYGFALGAIGGWVGHTGAGLGFQSLTMHDPASGLTVAILLRGTGADQNVPAHLFTALLD